mmetsp:Transcript_42499/g.128969  ORF Transcript_42499/g.128969 Transcript_42499/m.128969 type:complete len:88 (-) Transcript_42499:700-963(-)
MHTDKEAETLSSNTYHISHGHNSSHAIPAKTSRLDHVKSPSRYILVAFRLVAEEFHLFESVPKVDESHSLIHCKPRNQRRKAFIAEC